MRRTARQFRREIDANSGPAPWAHGNADRTAMRLVEKGQAPIKVHVPFLDAAHQLLEWADRLGRTCVLTNPAARAERVDLERSLRRRGERRVGQYRGQPKGRPKLGIDQRTVLAEFAETTGDCRRDHQDFRSHLTSQRLRIPALPAKPTGERLP